MTELILLAVVFVVTLAGMALMTSSSGRNRAIRRRLGGLRRGTPSAKDLEQQELAQPFSERVLKPAMISVGESLSRALPSRAAAGASGRLAEAGVKMSLAQFVAVKFLALAAVMFFTLFVLVPLVPAPNRPVIMLLGGLMAILAFRVPEFWLSRAISERRHSLQRQLPDVMDLLCISVEAGLGFDGAIQKVAEKFKDPVATEFSTYLAETRIGRPRAEALRSLARRANIPDMRAFTAAVIQADQLGVSLTKVLRAQSDSMRVKRKQLVQERAMQIPVKMLIPMVIFIFPTIFIVLLGPAVIQIVQMLGQP